MSYVTRVVLVTAITVVGWLFLVRFEEGLGKEMERCRVAYVYDGDTVSLDCGEDEVTARIAGLDAPETKEPGCEAELAHGSLATDRLRVLIEGGDVALRDLGRDRYDRMLIRMSVDGEDVADRMIREGLAVAYDGGTRIDWCERLGAGEGEEN